MLLLKVKERNDQITRMHGLDGIVSGMNT
jgi:hypothetical protein